MNKFWNPSLEFERNQCSDMILYNSFNFIIYPQQGVNFGIAKRNLSENITFSLLDV